MTIDQLIPAVDALSHADKIRLAQVVLQQLAQDEGAPSHLLSQYASHSTRDASMAWRSSHGTPWISTWPQRAKVGVPFRLGKTLAHSEYITDGSHPHD